MKRMFDNKVRETIVNSGMTIQEAADYAPKYSCKRRTLYNIRHLTIPLLLQTLKDIKLIDTIYSQTIDKKRFLLFDTNDAERIIAFSSDRQLEILSRCTSWHIDGTFRSYSKLLSIGNQPIDNSFDIINQTYTKDCKILLTTGYGIWRLFI